MTTVDPPDLLPDSFDLPAAEDAALWLRELLEHQAQRLADKTDGVLQPVVETRGGLTGADKLRHEFILVVPALDGYRYVLFGLEAGLDVPPAWLHSAGGALVELRTKDEIIHKLRELFAAPATLRVIQSLLALARDAETGED